jgi:alpha-tubulin suppressor-like RCC1 family protein
VTLSTATSGATIRYTTDGTEPTIASKIYSTPLSVVTTTEIRAKAYKADMTPSATGVGVWVINLGTVDTPRLSPGSGRYVTYQTVTVTTQTAGATIHYTTNGADPTTSDPTIASGGTLAVNQSTSLRVKAWKDGTPASTVGKGDYFLTGAVAAGDSHTLAVKADGTVWTWGKNDLNELGHTPYFTAAVSTPAQVTSITDVIAVAGGNQHSVALKRNGTVWTWGYGFDGELGDGTLHTVADAVQAQGLTNVIAVAAGGGYSVALKSDGTVWIWGNDGVRNYGSVPVQMTGLSGITSIAAKGSSTFAIKSDGEAAGTLWAWGDNTYGELGDGTFTSRSTAMRVAGLANVVQVANSGSHAVAVKGDGTVWTWGSNNWGQLGDATNTGRTTPIQSQLSLTTAVGAGSFFTLALQSPGPRSEPITWGWGLNNSGQLGNGTGSGSNNPVQNLATDIVTLVAGGSSGTGIRFDGHVWVWGGNGSGQLGTGNTSNVSTPVAVPNFLLLDNSALAGDPDGDGIPTWLEMLLGTDPYNADTNGDGISDAHSIDAGISPTNRDIDGDGVPNDVEIQNGTDPFRADTDGDGVPDGADCFPLDASRWQCPAPNPNDTTPPTITLTEPTTATLTGTNP